VCCKRERERETYLISSHRSSRHTLTHRHTLEKTNWRNVSWWNSLPDGYQVEHLR